jgi:hypothetical protein
MRCSLPACIARHGSARPYAGADKPWDAEGINVRPGGTFKVGTPFVRLRPRGDPMDELRYAIALLFRRKGREELTEREFVLSASMDLRWFPPRDAQRLLQLGLETKLLESHGGNIRPAFPLDSVEVPRDFVPTAKSLEVATPVSEDVFLRIVDAMVAATKTDRRSVIATINGVQEKMDMDVEVAALVAARQAGLEVGSFLESVKAHLGVR